MNVDVSACIDCGLCTRNCLFLSKYNINLKDYAEQAELAYNCYLCRDCYRVCPVNIDGKEISLQLRKDELENGKNLYTDGFASLLLEKKNYLFKNYRRANSKIAFFPGCNFPAYFPEATKLLSEKLLELHDITTIFDCCGKPIAELGLEKEQANIEQRIEEKLKKLNVEQLLLVCPNCYYYFKQYTNIKVSHIYEHEDIMKSLISNDYENNLSGHLFLPCPDKDERIIYNYINNYTNISDLQEIKQIQCCGAGGCAFKTEQDLSKSMQDSFNDYEETIYLYCATCAGMISKSNDNVEHILCKLLGVNEPVSAGINSLKNRILFALKN